MEDEPKDPSQDYPVLKSAIRTMEPQHKQLVLLRCKLVIVGDACVGKSALMQMFHSSGQQYPKNYVMTMGVDLMVKSLMIPDTNTMVELFMFDCAGQTIFNQLDMGTRYWENASAFMIVFDIGNRESLMAAGRWLQSIQASSQDGQPVPVILVGNKCEYRTDPPMEGRVAVATEEAQQFAQQHQLPYYECSAADYIRVTEPFQAVAQDFYNRYEDTVRKAEDLAQT